MEMTAEGVQASSGNATRAVLANQTFRGIPVGLRYNGPMFRTTLVIIPGAPAPSG